MNRRIRITRTSGLFSGPWLAAPVAIVDSFGVGGLPYRASPTSDPAVNLGFLQDVGQHVPPVSKLEPATFEYMEDYSFKYKWGVAPTIHRAWFQSYRNGSPPLLCSPSNQVGEGSRYLAMPPHWLHLYMRDLTFDNRRTLHAYNRLDTQRAATVFGRELFQEQDFSIWFLLRDLLELPSLVLSIHNSLQRLASELRRRSFKGSIRQIADLDLASQFGVLATISDIRKFFSVCKAFGGWLNATRTGMVPRRFRLPPVNQELAGLEFGSFSFNGATFRLHAEGTISYSSAVYYSLTAPEMISWGSRFLQLVDHFGVFSPVALWDLIPFSFIVDWFADVQSFLKKFKPLLSGLDLLLPCGCYSEKLNITMYVSPVGGGVAHELGGSTGDGCNMLTFSDRVAVGVYEEYYRFPGKPELDLFQIKSAFKEVKLRRVIISGDLALQRGLSNEPIRSRYFRRWKIRRKGKRALFWDWFDRNTYRSRHRGRKRIKVPFTPKG